MFFLRFFLGGVVFAVGFLYAFYFITKQLCRKYAQLSNINSILFLYSYPTLTPPPPHSTHFLNEKMFF